MSTALVIFPRSDVMPFLFQLGIPSQQGMLRSLVSSYLLAVDTLRGVLLDTNGKTTTLRVILLRGRCARRAAPGALRPAMQTGNCEASRSPFQ